MLKYIIRLLLNIQLYFLNKTKYEICGVVVSQRKQNFICHEHSNGLTNLSRKRCLGINFLPFCGTAKTLFMFVLQVK